MQNFWNVPCQIRTKLKSHYTVKIQTDHGAVQENVFLYS